MSRTTTDEYQRRSEAGCGTPWREAATRQRPAVLPLQWRTMLFIMAVLHVALSGCASVSVSSVAQRDYIALRRGDILTTGALSVSAMSTLQVAGVDGRLCRAATRPCREALAASAGLVSERRLAALAELWLMESLQRDAQTEEQYNAEAVLDAYLEAARHSYAYLFFSERVTAQRALEERQGQVRDYYNFSVQRAVNQMFNLLKRDPQRRAYTTLAVAPYPGGAEWQIRIRSDVGLAGKSHFPSDLIAASSLTFKGLHTHYRRDGIGAALVAATAQSVTGSGQAALPFRETPFPAATAILNFPGNSVEEVLSTKDAALAVYDPYQDSEVTLVGSSVPLAADFTAGYGLWLARSGFAAEALRTLLGKGAVLDEPRVYLMQPYDPQRRTIIMVHGLASSPEAWINVANEILGDDTLRHGYQIWQVYYPTNVPVPINNFAIRKALERTFAHFDPTGAAPASRDVVLIGHSMGGLLARLMVSTSGDYLWQGILRDVPLEGDRLERARVKLSPYLSFSPMPQVSRAVFVAAPHRGTPFASTPFGRLAANLVALPATVFSEVGEIARLLTVPGGANPNSPIDTANGIRNLSQTDPFIHGAAGLPISSAVSYHSIIATELPDIPLQESSDGVVPYRSAHLPNAASEKIIVSGHSVQETAPAILEIRRILHQHLQTSGLPINQ